MMKNIKYTIKESTRAKRMRLAVHCDGSVVVTVPQGVGRNVINHYVNSKKKWLSEKMHFFESVNQESMRTFSEEDFLEHKKDALVLVEKRIAILNKKHGFLYNDVLIKNLKTKWGSCTKRKNLHFNYKIIFLPKKQQDYIIAHELCHLKERNHSRKFWALVESIVPSYLTIKDELRNQELFY